MRERVAVAMSGGVDSSVAAALLKQEGFEVIGITMCFGLSDSLKRKPTCCGIEAIEDAKRVAHQLGIKHYVLNLADVLRQKVINNFCLEYIKGRTPNPCVRCNQYIKFGALLKKALALDCRYLATGHYVRKVKVKEGFLLKKGRDNNKDQSYFLYRLKQKQLKHILFPLGDLTKAQVRGIAQDLNLPVAKKMASQEICFLPNHDYRRFLETQITLDIKPGVIVDRKGNILGQHRGIPFYTIGQREGLNIALGWRAYVIKIDPRQNKIVLGRRGNAYAKEFIIQKPSFIGLPIKKRVVYKVKIRYNHRQAQAEILPAVGNLRVKFKQAQFAITPGQSAVIYNGDTVVGGGLIR